MSLFIIICLLLNLSLLSNAFKASAVTGEYPTVLPQPSNSQAVGYDKSTNKILILGGFNKKQAVTFNLKDNTFTNLGIDYMPDGTTGCSHYTQHTNSNNNLWMINAGGSGFIKMDTKTRNTVSSTVFPTTVSQHACLASHNNYLFVVGGWNDNQMQHIVQVYDLSHNIWITNVPLMQESRAVCGCIVNNNRLYVIAGLESDTIEWINIADMAHIDAQQWQYVNGHLPTTLRAVDVVNYGDEIIIIGGRSDDDVNPIYPVTIPVIDTAANRISIRGSLAYSVSLAGAVIVGQRIYVFGGYRGVDFVDSYQYIDLPDIGVSASLSGGSVFLIIVFVLFFAYCFGGYMFNGWTNRHRRQWCDVQANLPHLQFWKYLPVWTFIGCQISYENCQKRAKKEERERLIEPDEWL